MYLFYINVMRSLSVTTCKTIKITEYSETLSYKYLIITIGHCEIINFAMHCGIVTFAYRLFRI